MGLLPETWFEKGSDPCSRETELGHVWKGLLPWDTDYVFTSNLLLS